jgi:hypothetical protein
MTTTVALEIRAVLVRAGLISVSRAAVSILSELIADDSVLNPQLSPSY